MLIIGSSTQVQEYREAEGINQSELKLLKDGVNKYIEAKLKEQKRSENGEETPQHFKIGDCVDLALLGEEGALEQAIHVSTGFTKISDAIKKIVKDTFNQVGAENPEGVVMGLLEEHEEILERAIEISGWYANLKMPTRVDKVLKEGSMYFEDLKVAQGKKYILSQEEYNQIQIIVNSLKTNPRTSKYFDREEIQKAKNVKIYYQLPIYFKKEGALCKALFDLVVVFLDKKGDADKILPLDLKTMHDYPTEFQASFDAFRYDIQASFYSDGLQNPTVKLPKDFPTITEDTQFEPFTFIVESSTKPGKPLLFEAGSKCLARGRDGYKNKPGYLALLKEYLYQLENGFQEDSYITRLDGIIPLKADPYETR